MNEATVKLKPNGAQINLYIHDDDEPRPAVLIMPGGAYRYCAPGEGRPVAVSYFNHGYNAFVLEYSTTDGMFNSPVAPKEKVLERAMEDVESAVMYINKNCDKLHVEKEKIAFLGFSAGANLVLSSVLLKGLKPLCMILGYGAFSDEVINDLVKTKANLLNKVSAETPPIFMFMCQADPTVPATESLKLALRCAEENVPYELHCFVTGGHGLSLGTKQSGIVNSDYSKWFDMSLRFIENIQRDTPFVLGDISQDLEELSVESRIGALMYHEKAWQTIKKMLPKVALMAETDSGIRVMPLQRLYQWGIVESPSIDEVNEALDRIAKEYQEQNNLT